MPYAPNQLDVYTAAYSGALAGMTGVSGSQPTNASAANYAAINAAVQAFSQQFDTAWNAIPLGAPTTIEVEAIFNLCQAAWSGKGISTSAPAFTPSAYATIVSALIAIVQEADANFATEGIVSPPWDSAGLPVGPAGGDLFFTYPNPKINGISLFNVQKYGAKGDGITNDRTSIINALTAAAIIGGAVYFPATGHYYRSTGNISIPSNIQLIGEESQNAGSLVLGSIIRFEGAGTGFTLNGNDISIRDLVIAGDNLSDILFKQNAGTSFGFLRMTNVRFIIGNKIKAAIQFGTDADGQGANNNYSDFQRVDILSAPSQSTPVIQLYSTGSGLGLITFRQCTITGGGAAGGITASTAAFIRIESTDAGVTTPILFEEVSLEIPPAGGWELFSVANVTLKNCWAGDLNANPNSAPLINITTSPRTGAVPSRNILINSLQTDIGLVTPGLESINSLFNQDNITLINCKLPSINNGGPGGNPWVSLGCDIAHITGDIPSGVNGFGANGQIHGFLFDAAPATAGVVNGLNSDINPNQYTSYYRLTGAPSAPISVGGFVSFPLTPGRILVVDYQLGQVLTIVNEDASSTNIYRINTASGANVVLTTNCTIMFIYDGTINRWRIVSINVQ